jgi:uncharacterized tellurite resistance protein B-like protein
MAGKQFLMDVAKLMIAAAWADGDLSNDETNALKDLVFTMEDVNATDWKQLEMHMETPVGRDETEELLSRVVAGIKSEDDKRLVIDRLRGLFEADGTVTPEESALLREIESSASEASTGILAKLSKALGLAVRKRTERAGAAGARDAGLEEYIKNTVYYELEREQESSGVKIDLPEPQVRKLCLATGLLAHVANLDADMSDEERQAMRDILAGDWKIPKSQADLFVRVACGRTARGLDYFRLSRSYFESTEREERRAFLKTLFKVANAAGKTSNEEIEAIRRVSRSLRLDHKDFIAAKLTISKEDRKGL